jgi:serine/threonine protein kinase
LIKRTEVGYTTKLIDFDNAYIAGRPPPPEEIVGTINYYSPELLGYIQEVGVSASELGVGSDIFALGLIYTEYLTGAPPPFDVARYHEPAVAVRNRERLRIPRREIPTQLADLVDATQDEVGPPPSGALRGKGLRAALQRSPTTGSGRAGHLVGKLVRKRTDRPPG